MKLSATEEYGLRCLLQLARCGDDENLTIPEISRAEDLSVANAAKLMRMLRLGGIVESTRGQSGGYSLTRPANKITMAEALDSLGGPFYSSMFCDSHSGREQTCTHFVDCSLRSLWSTLQLVLTNVFAKITLQDLLCDEQEMSHRIKDVTGEVGNLVDTSSLR